MNKIILTLILSYGITIIIDNVLLSNTEEIIIKDTYFKQFKIKFLKLNKIKIDEKIKINNNSKYKVKEPKEISNVINNVSLSNKINILAIIINGNDKKVFFSDGKKEYFLTINDKYLNYKISYIDKNLIKLSKDNRITIIKFDKNNVSNIIMDNNSSIITRTKENKENNDFIVDSKLLDKYIKNPRKALREIYVSKKNNQYYISRLKNNSVFYNFGLRKNDIIISLNEEPISETLFLNIYKNYKKIDTLNIEIERYGEKLEFNYEIER